MPPLGWHDTLCFLALPAALVVAQTISMRVLSPPPDPNDKAAQNANRVLKYLPLMIGYFSANVPSGLGLYWMTSNVFSLAGSLGAKAYLKQNPPKLDVELKELGRRRRVHGRPSPGDARGGGTVDARLKAQPVRAPIRPGINAVPAFLAVDVGDLTAWSVSDGVDRGRDRFGGRYGPGAGGSRRRRRRLRRPPRTLSVSELLLSR